MRRLWPTPDEDLFITKHVNASTRIGVGGMEMGGSAIRADEGNPPITGGMEMGGEVDRSYKVSISGGMEMGGSAIRADEATMPTPIGGMEMGGVVIGSSEFTFTPSGGMEMGGFVEVAHDWHYGFWPSYGFWPKRVGWWFEPNYKSGVISQ
jgi:hypothetical protein